jgi:hypothetical protein
MNVAPRIGRNINIWRFIRENAWIISATFFTILAGLAIWSDKPWWLSAVYAVAAIACIITYLGKWAEVGQWTKGTGLPAVGNFILWVLTMLKNGFIWAIENFPSIKPSNTWKLVFGATIAFIIWWFGARIPVNTTFFGRLDLIFVGVMAVIIILFFKMGRSFVSWRTKRG